jgi:acetyl esterase
MLTAESRRFYYDCYNPVRADVRASPLLGDLAGLPPAVVLTAGLDPVRDEGRAYAAGLITAGVATSYLEAVGNIHAFVVMRKAVPSSVTDIERALTALRAHLVVQN